MSEFYNRAYPYPRSKLPALPEFEPAADLWSRIEHRHARRRRARWVGGVGVAAALLLAVAVVRITATIGDGDSFAEQRVETLQLEQDWQALGLDEVDGYAQLRPLDVALQQAYDRHADGAELGQLWNQRNQRLRELIRSRRNDSAIHVPGSSRITI